VKWCKNWDFLIWGGCLTQRKKPPPPLRSKLYINDRKPKKGTFTNRSRLKIGRHSFANRLSFVKDLQFDWIGDYSDNYIRANLK